MVLIIGWWLLMMACFAGCWFSGRGDVPHMHLPPGNRRWIIFCARQCAFSCTTKKGNKKG